MGTVLPEAVPRCNDVGLNLRAATYLALLTVSAGVFFGLVPLLAGPHHALATAMSEASGRMAGTAPRWERLRKLLVVAELGMDVVLLATAGLLVRSFGHLIAVDVGFRPDHVVVLPITLDNHEYDSGAKTRAYYRSLTEKLASVPGVVAVGGVTALPMSPDRSGLRSSHLGGRGQPSTGRLPAGRYPHGHTELFPYARYLSSARTRLR